MKVLWDKARYPVIKQEFLYTALCLRKSIPREILQMILEYVAVSRVHSDTCECLIDRCHWCVYQHTDAMTSTYPQLQYHKGCGNCTSVSQGVRVSKYNLPAECHLHVGTSAPTQGMRDD